MAKSAKDKRNEILRIKEQIYGIWRSRSEEERRLKHTIQFTDDMWNQGLRLASPKQLHYQHVMSVIRDLITAPE
jgi:hypothetical protein